MIKFNKSVVIRPIVIILYIYKAYSQFFISIYLLLFYKVKQKLLYIFDSKVLSMKLMQLHVKDELE
jgi:hypothetical protein